MRKLRVSLSTVQDWVPRAGGERLDWADAPRGGRPVRGTVIFFRRINDRGEVELLGRPFHVDPL